MEFIKSLFAVQFLKTNSGKKGAGMPVVRNPQFNFKEGLCWSDINTTFLKCRQKQKSINDVKSMSLYGLTDLAPEYYIICLINSKFMSYYVDTYVNNTQTFQINDARQLPIIIPNKQQLNDFRKLFDRALNIKKSQFNGISANANEKLQELQEQLDLMVENLYSI
ncbi:MAG TPA: DNA modification methylase [Clostridia bacterium]|nr:DNA modification methylase [Clostridia bacterium]